MSTDGQQRGVVRYEDILRAIGRYIDANSLQDVIVLQSPDGILLRGYRQPEMAQRGPTLVQHLFTVADIATIDEEARKRRGTGSRLMQ
ncbi:MAG TPA: hypothetical protein VMU89_22620 [Thermomicrobiaceae bacterium]|nr:hypothetical protein [Thermomicrobiaceae bacterium]